MAHSAPESNASLIITVVMASLVSFGIGFAVGNWNSGTDGMAPLKPGAGRAPSFAASATKGGPSMGRGTGTGKDSDILPIGSSYVLGDASAPVTIVEFSDFQCPYCKRGADTMNQVKKAYGNDVRIVFKHYPLPFHKQAPAASRAALAAGEQGKFWEMHDLLFANFKNFRQHASDMKEYTSGFAEQLGLDVAKFKADFDKPEYKKVIDGDMRAGQKVGVRGTPHFFVNGTRLSGAQPFPKFKAAIDAELKKAKAALASGTSSDDLYAKMVKLNYKKAEAPKRRQPRQIVDYVPVNANDPAKGNTKDYLVTIVEFSDFQCPFCTRVNPTLKQIEEKYGKEVRIVFKQLPLPFHKQAPAAAAAALAAGKQGKFWEMHDLLFANQRRMREPELWVELANKLGLNVAKFEKDMKSAEIVNQVKADTALAGKVGARGTPNFFVNGVNVVGAQPFPKFQAEIEKQIKKAKAIKAKTGLSGEALYKAVALDNKKNAPKAPPRPAQPSAKVDTKLLKIGKAATKGPKNAKVTIFEFSDFQCPFCNRANNNLNQALKKYDGKVKVVFKHYPLPFHKQAPDASVAAMAAGEQGKFWEMHDLLFANFKKFKSADMQELTVGYAQQLGLNVDKFKKDYANPAFRQIIKTDMQEGQRVQVRGTPTFFINGTRLVGAQPPAKFEAAIEAALKGK